MNNFNFLKITNNLFDFILTIEKYYIMNCNHIKETINIYLLSKRMIEIIKNKDKIIKKINKNFFL